MMFVDDRTINVNQSDLENIFKICRDSSSTWLTAYGIYVFIIALIIVGPISILYTFVVLLRFLCNYNRNRHFNDDDDENIEEILEFDFDCFYRFVSEQTALTIIYVFLALICHILMCDTPVTSMWMARWWIEGIIDIPCFTVLFESWDRTSIYLTYYRSYLNVLTVNVLIGKIILFCLFRYSEFDRESEFNTYLVRIFRHYCLASHYSRASDHPIFTFVYQFILLWTIFDWFINKCSPQWRICAIWSAWYLGGCWSLIDQNLFQWMNAFCFVLWEMNDTDTKYKETTFFLFLQLIDCSILVKRVLSFQRWKGVRIWNKSSRRIFQRYWTWSASCPFYSHSVA